MPPVSVMRSFLVEPLPKGLLRAVSIAFVDPRFLALAGHALGARNQQADLRKVEDPRCIGTETTPKG
eukprot:CAMPEP_0180092632 /NCGR_PEP_ID=MMETSP0985-20121206/24630_1 /TAXON_ID=483367 /ORGANISM="non described non described, Strain CCMP 2436" /LENGTH=66 /DNA_ID=CAMNT_0022027637 /DNA_START=375 /DNA_END=571 /DNA_ORIENTATION=+